MMKKLFTLLCLLMTMNLCAQEWETLETQTWVHEWRTMSKRFEGSAQTDGTGAYKIYVRSEAQALAAGNMEENDGHIAQWDSQFFVTFGEENALKVGDVLSISFSIKADAATTISTQSDTAPGAYLHWAAIGDVGASTSWKEVSRQVTVTGENNTLPVGTYSIAFNLSDGQENNVYFKDFVLKVKHGEEEKEITWTNIIVNSDLSGKDMSCFYQKVYPAEEASQSSATDGAIVINSPAKVSKEWETGFFIVLPQILPAGTKFKVSFKCKASANTTITPQCHNAPAQYIHWDCFGEVPFSTEWATFATTAIVPEDCDGSDSGGYKKDFKTICFNLPKDQDITYYFDNIVVAVDKDIAVNPQPFPVDEAEKITIETYDFVALYNGGYTTIKSSGTKSFEGKDLNVITSFTNAGDEIGANVGGRIAALYQSGNGSNFWMRDASRPWFVSAGKTSYMAFDNLKAGDVVKVIGQLTPLTILCDNVDGYANGTTLEATYTEDAPLELVAKADGYIYGSYGPYTTIKKIIVESSAAETANDPIITVTAAKDDGRTVTIDANTGSAGTEQEAYYTLDGSTPSKASTKYTSPFNVGETTTVKAVAYCGESVSNVVTLEVEAGFVIKLNDAELKINSMQAKGSLFAPVYTVSVDNSQLIGAPTASLQATFLDEDVTDALVSGTFIPNANGELVVTSTAEGYESSTVRAVVYSDYNQTYASADYSTLTDEVSVQNALGTEWSKAEGSTRWANWNKNNSIYGDQYYVYNYTGEAVGNIWLDKDNMLRGPKAIQFMESFGFGRGVSGATKVFIPDTGTPQDITLYRVINSKGLDVNTYTETFVKSADIDGNSYSEFDIPGCETLCQVVIYSPAQSSDPEELVVPPAGVEPEDWALEGFWGYDNGRFDVIRAIEVAFDGNEVYVQGLAFYFGDAWLKGTLNTETGIITFPSGQFVGQDASGNEYMVGYDGDFCDIQYEYDAEAKTLTQLTLYILESQTKTGHDEKGYPSYWGYWIVSSFRAGEPVEVTPVTAPKGLETETYVFTASCPNGDEWETYAYQIQIGFDGKDVYLKGFSDDISDMWAKGTLSEDGKTVTIPAKQYIGYISSWDGTYDFYLTAMDEYGAYEDIVLAYDAKTNTFSTNQTIILNGSMFTYEPYQFFKNVEIIKMADVAATPADPSINDYKLEGVAFPYIEFVIPTQDTEGNELLTSKLFYIVWIEQEEVEQPFTVIAAQYRDVEEDWVEIPYEWDDRYDIYKGGSTFYFNPTDAIVPGMKIGIQSIYYGGGVRNTSNIVWMDKPVGINHVNAETDNKVVIFDLQGRRVTVPTKGLYIVNGKKVMMR